MTSLPEDVHDLDRLLALLDRAADKADASPIPAWLPEHGWLDPYAGGRRSVKRYTLVHVLDRENRRCLLGRKKRGLGAGLINGFGGKLEPGETSIACAARELEEECGLSARSLRFHGRLVFTFESALVREQGADRTPLVDLYVCDAWEGEAVETEEMAPVWTDLDKIPYAEMWEEANLYLPALLDASPDTQLYGRVDYAAAETRRGQDASVGVDRETAGVREGLEGQPDPQGGMRPVAWAFCVETGGTAAW